MQFFSHLLGNMNFSLVNPKQEIVQGREGEEMVEIKKKNHEDLWIVALGHQVNDGTPVTGVGTGNWVLIPLFIQHLFQQNQNEWPA